jgi:thioredoxin-related protein
MNSAKLKVLFYFLLIAPTRFCFSQGEGVHFMQGLSWEAILKKANGENKYIFMDCYATWCGPCKQMDNKIYSNPMTGDSVNANFIAVKVQIDTSVNDDDNVKKWYSTAAMLIKEYRVTVFPTYLFFSPDGKLVYRETGYKNQEDFLSVLHVARTKDSRLYTLLDQFNHGKLPYDQMPGLAKQVKELLKDTKKSEAIARKFLTGYLSKLYEDQLLTKTFLNFLLDNATILRSKHNYFKLMRTRSHEVDSVLEQKGISYRMVNYIISKEQIFSKIRSSGKWADKEPNWAKMNRSIQKKYGNSLAYENILNAKINWYHYKNQIDSAIKYEVKKIDYLGLDTTYMGCAGANNVAFDLIFKYSQDTDILKKAVGWMSIIISKYPGDDSFIDTYANLLYKIGRKSEAIEWEEKAVMLAPKNNSLKATLAKMKANAPTWLP